MQAAPTDSPAITTSLLSRLLLVLFLLGASGCKHWREWVDVHATWYTPTAATAPVEDLAIPQDLAAPPVAGCQQSQVHVFIIHGLDPFDVANLRGVREYCHQRGYLQTTYAQFYHGPQVVERIRLVKANDPNAKILAFGFSAGTLTTRHVVNTLHSKHGIDVDVVLYTSGITMLDREYNRPGFVGKVIHVRDRSLVTAGVELSAAENYKYNDAWHFGTPAHQNTLDLLGRELDRLARETPIVLPPGLPHQAASAPTHTTLKTENAPSKPSSWDVVRPSTSLLPPPRFVAK